MGIITPQLSKEVGLKSRDVAYPSLGQVEGASHFQLLEWHRFLPSPDTDERVEVLNEIEVRVSDEDTEE